MYFSHYRGESINLVYLILSARLNASHLKVKIKFNTAFKTFSLSMILPYLKVNFEVRFVYFQAQHQCQNYYIYIFFFSRAEQFIDKQVRCFKNKIHSTCSHATLTCHTDSANEWSKMSRQTDRTTFVFTVAYSIPSLTEYAFIHLQGIFSYDHT